MSRLEKKLLELITNEYTSLGKTTSVEEAGGYSINSRNYLLGFSKHPKVICKYIKNIKKNEERHLSKLLSIINFCRKKGSKVPSIILSDSGKMLFKYQKGIFYLLLFIDAGRFSGNIAEIADFGRQLAILHKHLKKCNIRYTFVSQQYAYLSDEELNTILGKIRKKNNLSDFDGYIAANIGFLRSQYNNDRIQKQKINKNKITFQYIHYDLHPSNALFKNGKTAAILDFSALRRGELARDVAFACYRFGLWKPHKKNEIQKRMKAFLDSYLAINRLTAEERSSLKYYFINECLNRISYIIREHYFNNNHKWSFDIAKHINNIKLAKGVTEND